jgi:DNA-binding NarL/FixJ family response regulator
VNSPINPVANKRTARKKKSSHPKAAEKEPLRVSVLESDPLRFLGLRTLFGSGAEFHVRSSTVPMILKALDDDVVLMTRNRGAAFYSGMAALKTVRPGVRIIVTGPGGSDEDILRAMTAGAKGYVADDASPAEFKQAIRVVHSGSVWAPRRVLATFIERATASTATRKVQSQDGQMISSRQRQVLGLLAVGSSNREIAKELGLTERTVKAHVAELLRKIGAPNRIALSVHPLTHTLLAAVGDSGTTKP